MKDIPYLLTTLIAHTLVLELDNRRNIKIDDLIKFRQLLFEKYLEQYQEYGDHTIGEKWEGNISFAPVDDVKEIKNLLIEYPEIFYFQDDSLWIHENIDLAYLYKLKEDEFSNICHKFNRVSDLKQIRNSLGITKIYELGNFVNQQLENIESQLEQAYNDLNNSKDLIKPLLTKKFLFLTNVIANYPVLSNQFNIITSSDEENSVSITEDYDYIKESFYTKNKETYPIDNNLYKNSDYYENIAWLCNPIQESIEDTYQYAIFSDFSLYKHKVSEIFCQLSFMSLVGNNNSNNNPDNNLDFDIDEFLSNVEKEDLEKENKNRESYAVLNNNALEEEFIFWLTYIHKINEYLVNNYDKNLVKVKNRLLYLLDDVSKCLYIDENFETIYEEAMEKLEELKDEYEEKKLEDLVYSGYYKYLAAEDEDEDYLDEEEYDDEDYSDEDGLYGYLGKESKYLIYDCFLGREYKVVEKLLLISTYYSLTNNEKIEEILDSFEDHPKYSIYKDIIMGKNYGKILTK